MRTYVAQVAGVVLRWAGYACIIVVFMGLPAYVAFDIGVRVGKGEGFIECRDATVFPTMSDFEKVRRYFNDND